VKLTYKGDPQDFDIVVGCNVRRITYKDNSSTYEVGLVPDVFGRRMSDDKALMVRPPNACKGETTANGWVQPDLLPVVIVYDDADTLDFGTAYLSEDAYDNPLSVIKFGSATIESAKLSDFDKSRRTEKNVLSRELYHSTFGDDVRLKLHHVDGYWAHPCEGFDRIVVPDELRDQIHQLWPSDHPSYWTIEPSTIEHQIVIALSNSKAVRSDEPDSPPHAFSQWDPVSKYEADFGLPTRVGGGLISKTRGYRFPAATYPAASDLRRDLWPRDKAEWPSYIADAHEKFARIAIDFRAGRTKGLAYCSVPMSADDSELLANTSIRALARVDGNFVEPHHSLNFTPFLIFERDQFAFVHFYFNLESTRGDL
jgi:hypothetical protein